MKKRVFTIALAAALVGTMMAQEVEHRKEVYVIKAGKASGINTATPSEQKEIGRAVMEFMYDYKYLTDTTDNVWGGWISCSLFYCGYENNNSSRVLHGQSVR